MTRVRYGALLLLWTAIVFFGGWRAGRQEIVTISWSPAGGRVAFVKDVAWSDGPSQELWMGENLRKAARVYQLAPDSEWCDEIAWTRDGSRVGFLIKGERLLVFKVAGQGVDVDLQLVSSGGSYPGELLARGIAIEDSGGRITFDICPRSGPGCTPGAVQSK